MLAISISSLAALFALLGGAVLRPPGDPPRAGPAVPSALALEFDRTGDGDYVPMPVSHDKFVGVRVRLAGGGAAGTYVTLLSSVFVEEASYFEGWDRPGARAFLRPQAEVPFERLLNDPRDAGFPPLQVKEDQYWSLFRAVMPPGGRTDRVHEYCVPILGGRQHRLLSNDYYRWNATTRAFWQPVVLTDVGEDVFAMPTLLQQYFAAAGLPPDFFVSEEWTQLIGRYTLVLVVQAVGFQGGSIVPSLFPRIDPDAHGQPPPGLFDWPRDERATGKTISAQTQFRMVLANVLTRPKGWGGEEWPALIQIPVSRRQPAAFPLLGLTRDTWARVRFATGAAQWLPVASAGPGRASVTFDDSTPLGPAVIDLVQTRFERVELQDVGDQPKFFVR